VIAAEPTVTQPMSKLYVTVFAHAKLARAAKMSVPDMSRDKQILPFKWVRMDLVHSRISAAVDAGRFTF
jgi:hypothetical protein